MVGSRYDAPHCDYSDKGKAIRALTGDNRFTKDIDYNKKNSFLQSSMSI